jgi:hypothetical protein
VTVIPVYNANEDPTTILDPEPTTVLPRGSRFALSRWLGPRGGVVASVIVGVVVAVAATGIGLFTLSDDGRHTTPPAQQSGAQTGSAGAPGDDRTSRQAWARQYGQDRSAMPDLPDVASATPQQQAAAADLLARTQSSTAVWSDTAKAQSAGYDVQAALARAEQAQPRLAQRLHQIDAGHATVTKPLLRVVNKADTRDGRVLDPTAPQMLLYTYQGHNSWKLIGAGYLANPSYPQAPPEPGGPITRWHYTDKQPGTLAMDVFFVAGNDLAHAYALTPPKT